MRIVTRELPRLERAKFASHLRALGTEDRRLRFGLALPDAAIDAYVARIDFGRDAVFGVFDDALKSQFDTLRRLILAGVLTVPPSERGP